MVRDENGVFSVTIGPLTPDLYYYNFRVNGVFMLDPHNMLDASGIQAFQAVRSKHSLVEVAGAEGAFHELREVPHGTVHVEWYSSVLAGRPRRLHVYTPPGYNPASPTLYPVLYLYHGAGADDSSWIEIMRMNWIVDNLIAAKAAKPLIIVMPEWFGAVTRDAKRYSELHTAAQSTGREPGDLDLIDEVLPFVEGRYRIDRRATARAIAGFSAGGYKSFDTAMRHLDKFSHVGVFGMDPIAVFYRKSYKTRYAGALSDVAATNARLKLLWMACGETDRLCNWPKGPVSETPDFDSYEILSQAGIRYTRILTPGGHTFVNFRRNTRDFIAQLFQ